MIVTKIESATLGGDSSSSNLLLLTARIYDTADPYNISRCTINLESGSYAIDRVDLVFVSTMRSLIDSYTSGPKVYSDLPPLVILNKHEIYDTNQNIIKVSYKFDYSN